MTEQIIFYVFAALLIFSAGMVISVRNPVHAALFLVLAFFSSAAIWLLLEAEFLAITLILVYVGAVMVLFLFVVMMLDINMAKIREGFIRYLPIGAGVAAMTFGAMWVVLRHGYFGTEIYPIPENSGGDYSNTRALGEQLYTHYVYPFEIASVILLVAIIAAIALTLRHRATTRFQNVDEQVATRKEERLRIVSMEAEERK